jgi:hypothetical protein
VTSAARRVAFAAGPDALDLDAGWPLLRDAAGAAGLEPAVEVWEDPAVDWAAYHLVVAMYTWGYILRRSAFVGWAEEVARRTRLVNPAPVLAWSSDKAYLADLAAAGLPVVPTAWVPPGGAWDPPGRDFVVKPTVASGAIGAGRYATHGLDAARRHVERLHAEGHTVMVQPYVRSVDAHGEAALVFLGGELSHAVGKHAVLEPGVGPVFGLWERQVVEPLAARADQRALAERVLRVVQERLGPTAYARLDLVDGEDGAPMVIELELIEPALFLDRAPAAAGRLAGALRREAAVSRGGRAA